MGETQKRPKTMSGHGFCQFELLNAFVKNLKHFELSPNTRWVIAELITHYNPLKADIFPKQKTIAENLGVSEASVIRAISQLHKEGLIVSERKYTNRYKFTQKFLNLCGLDEKNFTSDKLQHKNKQIESNKLANCEVYKHEQIREQKKQQKVVSLDSFEDENCEILRDYARRNGARNVSKYVSFLKTKGLDKKIIANYKANRGAEEFAKKQIVETKKLIKEYKSFKAEAPTQNWKDLKKKLMEV